MSLTTTPFQVDTLVMELTRQEWSLRGLSHPQPLVRRADDGSLVDLGGGDQEEAWMALEIYPPLGHAAAELSGGLVDGLRACLSAVDVTVADWQPMLDRCRQAAAEVRADGLPGSTEAVEFLDWLTQGHFVFVGYAYYTGDTAALVPIDGSQLGVLRGETAVDRINGSSPHARRAGNPDHRPRPAALAGPSARLPDALGRSPLFSRRAAGWRASLPRPVLRHGVQRVVGWGADPGRQGLAGAGAVRL